MHQSAQSAEWRVLETLFWSHMTDASVSSVLCVWLDIDRTYCFYSRSNIIQLIIGCWCGGMWWSRCLMLWNQRQCSKQWMVSSLSCWGTSVWVERLSDGSWRLEMVYFTESSLFMRSNRCYFISSRTRNITLIHVEMVRTIVGASTFGQHSTWDSS